MSKYDFTSPESAAKSMLEINSEVDVRANLEISRHRNGGSTSEILRTDEVNKVADYQDKKIVFVSYLQNGKKKKETLTFEKNLESKLWMPVTLLPYSIEDSNAELAKEMREWE